MYLIQAAQVVSGEIDSQAKVGQAAVTPFDPVLYLDSPASSPPGAQNTTLLNSIKEPGESTGYLQIRFENLYPLDVAEHKAGLPSGAGTDQAREYFKKHANEDAGELARLCRAKEVCGIGEKHSSLTAKEYLAANIGDLSRQGYNLLGFEMINQRDQKLLDGYMTGTVSRKALLSPGAFVEYDYASGAPEGYVKILDAMKDFNRRTGANLKPLAIEVDYDRTDPDRNKTMNARDVAWAKFIDETLKQNPGSKVAVYCGADHLGVRKDFSSLNQELLRLGRESAAVQLDSANPHITNGTDSTTAANAAVDAGATHAFSYPIEMGASGVRRGDFAVFVPWKEPVHYEIGRDITEPAERGKTRTGQLDFNGVDPDGKFYVTTDNAGLVSRLEYTGGGRRHEIAPRQAEDLSDQGRDGWIIFKNGSDNDATVMLLRDGKPVAKVTIVEGKLTQIRGNPVLIYPPLE
jgi:hypothetical protein